MAPEFQQHINDEKFDEFLRVNYPIKLTAVEETIKYADKNRGELTSVQYLMARAGLTAKTHGIEGLPVILAAVWKLENDLPEGEETRLDAKTYIGLLMTGENTSANKEADQTGSLQDSYDHGQRAHILYNYWEEL